MEPTGRSDSHDSQSAGTQQASHVEHDGGKGKGRATRSHRVAPASSTDSVAEKCSAQAASVRNSGLMGNASLGADGEACLLRVLSTVRVAFTPSGLDRRRILPASRRSSLLSGKRRRKEDVRVVSPPPTALSCCWHADGCSCRRTRCMRRAACAGGGTQPCGARGRP